MWEFTQSFGLDRNHTWKEAKKSSTVFAKMNIFRPLKHGMNVIVPLEVEIPKKTRTNNYLDISKRFIERFFHTLFMI